MCTFKGSYIFFILDLNSVNLQHFAAANINTKANAGGSAIAHPVHSYRQAENGKMSGVLYNSVLQNLKWVSFVDNYTVTSANNP